MGLLDSLLTLDVVTCAGVKTGTISVLSGTLNVTINGVVHVNTGGRMMPANCTGNTGGNTGGGGTSNPSSPLSSVTPGYAPAVTGAALGFSASPTTTRSTGTCGVCVLQRVPLNADGLVVTHPKRRSTSGTCRGSLTLPRENRPTKDRV
jgi:hypothetical protein